MTFYAAIEGGGTTWVAAICKDKPDNIIDSIEIPTTTPEETLLTIKEWLLTKEFVSIGIASFGPIDARRNSPKYGYITSTPKPNWGWTDVLGLLGIHSEFKDIPHHFDTDVNAPAMAEFISNGHLGISSCAYITVGTGVGVGLVINNKTVHGMMHPEAGHLQVKQKDNDTFKGTCPFHGCCIEGMVSAGACAKRKGIHPSELKALSDDDEVWDFFAYYLAQLCASIILMVSAEKIVIGGGVMNRESLFPRIREYTVSILNNYIQHDDVTNISSPLIGPSVFGSKAGIIGAAFLAYNVHKENNK